MKQYSTAEVARQIGVAKTTLLRWLRAGKVEEPEQKLGQSRVWFETDVERAKAFKNASYGKRP